MEDQINNHVLDNLFFRSLDNHVLDNHGGLYKTNHINTLTAINNYSY